MIPRPVMLLLLTSCIPATNRTALTAATHTLTSPATEAVIAPITSYPAVPPGRSPFDASLRPDAMPGTLLVTTSVREWGGEVHPSSALVNLWPATVEGDSIAADRRMKDRAWWSGPNWVNRTVDAYVWCAWPDSNGLASFPRLPALPVYVATCPAVEYPEGRVWKPAVMRVDMDGGTTVVSLEAR